MKRDVEKMLGGWAAGTLTAEEQRALMEAALENQELFNQLAAEQPLKEALEDPAVRSRIRAATEPRRRLFAWHWGWSAAVGAAAVSVLTFAVCRWEFGLGTRKLVSEAEIASRVAEQPAAALAPAGKPAAEDASAKRAAVGQPRETAVSKAAARKGAIAASVPRQRGEQPPVERVGPAPVRKPMPEPQPRQASRAPEAVVGAALPPAASAKEAVTAEASRAAATQPQTPSAPLAGARLMAVPPPAARGAGVQSQLAAESVQTAALRRAERSDIGPVEAKSAEEMEADTTPGQAGEPAAAHRELPAPAAGFAAAPGAVARSTRDLRTKVSGVVYRIERLGADGSYAPADPATTFARTDSLRLVFSVPVKAVVSVSAGQVVLWNGTAPAGREQPVAIPPGARRVTIEAAPELATGSLRTRPATVQIVLRYE